MITAGVGRRSRVSGGEAMALTKLVLHMTTRRSRTAPAFIVRPRRMPIKRRLIFTAIVLAIVVLALGGWAVQAFRR